MACKWMIIQNGAASFPRFEAIAHPRLRQDVLRRARIELQLLSQLADEDAQIFVLFDAVAAPHRVEDRAVSQYFPWMLRHIHQHVKLLGSESHFPVGDRYGMRLEINVEVAKVDLGLRSRCTRRRTSKRCANSCQQLAGAERLGYVVIGARIERRDFATFFAAYRQHE